MQSFEPRMIGDSECFRATRELLARIARCLAPVLIEGETGTGKECAARAIHYDGPRKGGAFVPVNCGAIPDALLEGELFGYRRGAFTDAKEASLGVLRLADRGTLFLDEVDALSPRAQIALLRFLQERKVRPLGEGTEIPVDVRVISASNRHLKSLVTESAFRQDLYYRLNVMYVDLPPLRLRIGDIPLMVEHFLSQIAERDALPTPTLDAESRAWVEAQSWLGNIRELENFVEREFLLADGARAIRVSTLGNSPAPSDPACAEGDCLNYRKAKERVLSVFNQEFLMRLMRSTKGNVTLAARVSGKERRDLARLLQRYEIAPAAFRA